MERRLIALLVLLAEPAGAVLQPQPPADPYEAVAAQLARTTRASGGRRVAVLAFHGIGGREAAGGRIVAERLIGRLLNGGLEVVERALLDAVMREQRLEVSGIVDSQSVRELGRVLDVDALVVGTVAPLKNGGAEINARVISVGSARVIAAAAARVERDWNDALFEDSGWSLKMPDVAVPGEPDACGRSREAAQELERALVDLKARYWAQRLREGLDPRSLKRNPGQEIADAGIRSAFYARLRHHVDHPGPPLTDADRARLRDVSRRIAAMSSVCS